MKTIGSKNTCPAGFREKFYHALSTALIGVPSVLLLGAVVWWLFTNPTGARVLAMVAVVLFWVVLIVGLLVSAFWGGKLGERLSDRADVGGGTFFLIYVVFNVLGAVSFFVVYMFLCYWVSVWMGFSFMR
jgi:hypothetical protein